MLRCILLAATLGTARGIGVSAPKTSTPKREPPPLPWQDCPWLLQDRVDLRSMTPPQWCYSLKYVGKAECERAYLSPEPASGGHIYRKCVYNDGRCTMEPEGSDCRMEYNPTLPVRPVEPAAPIDWDAPSPPPPPPPSPQVVAVRAIRPSPSPPPEVADPFAPSMRLQAPRLISADCRSVTLTWSTPPAAMASGVPPRFAVYFGTEEPGSEKPWNMGLRSMGATVTGLTASTSYSFYVAMSQTRGWGPRSPPLPVSTSSTCASTSDQMDCSGVTLGPPLVTPLNCMAMVVELPPMPTAGRCSASGREVVVQMRVMAEPWGDIRRDVHSSARPLPTFPLARPRTLLTSARIAQCNRHCHGGGP